MARLKSAYVVQRAIEGVFTDVSSNTDVLNSTQDCIKWVKNKAVPGEYRIIAVRKAMKVNVETVEKVTIA